MHNMIRRIWNLLCRLERPLADGLFVILLLAAVIISGWLVARHDRIWDWTSTATNSLTPQSLAILARLDAPLHVTIFAALDTPISQAVKRVLAPYAQALPELLIESVDPQRFPEQARDAEVSLSGQILLEYRGRRETLKAINERTITAAISRLIETRAPWVAVIEGHGERAINGTTGSDLGRFGQALKAQGYLVRPLDLAKLTEIPDNTRLIVLSTPGMPLFPSETERLTRYLARGGNLLWLLDPGPLNGLEPVAQQLGLHILPGVVVDAAAARLGLDTPIAAIISDYPQDALATGLTIPSLLMGSVAFEPQVAPDWTLLSYLTTGAQSWNETGRIEGEIHRDEVVGEVSGPLPVILALTRPRSAENQKGVTGIQGEQRVVVTGDGDFLSNAQLGSYGNRALGMRLLGWLSRDEALLELPPAPGTPTPLILDSFQRMLLGLGALVLLPASFLGIGLTVRWRRWRGQ